MLFRRYTNWKSVTALPGQSCSSTHAGGWKRHARPLDGVRIKGSIMNISLRQKLLASTLLVGASALATPAFAQDQSVDPAQQPPSGAVEGQPTPSVSSQGETVQQSS